MTDITLDLDTLLDAAVLEGALASGRDPRLAARQFGVSRVTAAAASESGTGTANRWSDADAALLAAWSGRLSAAEIAARLGRTASGIITQQYLRGLPTPLKHPEYVSGQEMADALGVDSHSILLLIERGRLPAERMPVPEMTAWRMRRTAFYAWATRPENWVYFIRSVRNPARIADEKLRRLIERRAAAWPDEWWSIGEVADWHGVIHQDINKYLRRGVLPGVKWNNWWIRRSDATRLRIFTRADGQLPHRGTAAMDAFIVLAVAVGIPYPHIARMTRHGSAGGAPVRYAAIDGHGLVPWLVRSYDLPVEIRGDRIWADWRDAGHRFPAVARAWAKWADGSLLTSQERYALAGTARAAVVWARGADDALAVALSGQGLPSRAALAEAVAAYWKLVDAGPQAQGE